MSFLKHIGTKRHSGRYPWGSGDDPQRSTKFLGYVKQLKSQGFTEKEIADGMNMKISELRAKKSIAKAEMRAAAASQAQKLKEKGMSNVAIGRKMGINESSVRALLDPVLQNKADITFATAEMIRNAVDKKGLIDIGKGVETHIGISRTKLDTAVALLKEEGYKIHYVKTEQLGTGKFTWMKVLSPPDVKYAEVYKNRDKIKLIDDYTQDSGKSYFGLEPINSVSRNRISVRYGDEGGSDKDGVIELRRGIDDISLGNAKYAQVRIGVEGNMFMKGMAIYSDDMPKGVDIIYNTNKKKGADDSAVFKKMEDDPDNPFGSIVRQKHYTDKNGNDKLSALNIVNEEGAWSDWSRNLSSQVLSKQSVDLAKRQLGLAYNLKKEEFDEIMTLTNPVVKKRLLQAFSDEADSAAVHLKAAALPRQANHAILPIPKMKENEIYAPGFENGESVVLIRHPHGGTFEIPRLTVNNKNPSAISIMNQARDAVGIHPKVASKLSGADFDGDTVLVIPDKDGRIKTSPSLKALQDFDTKSAYPPYDGMKTIDGGTYNAKTKNVEYPSKGPRKSPKQMHMGDVSNLITDMTIKGASDSEIARAVKHSMVVIDSEKHHLNHKQSYLDNNIAELKEKYQGSKRAGASTVISKASSDIRVPFRKEGALIGPISKKTGKRTRVYIDPKTGKKLYEETGETYIDKNGKVVKKTIKSTKMAEIDDAHKLSSGTKMESIYADHANALKSLANRARLAYLDTPDLVYSPTAKRTYSNEVSSLKTKLALAFRNKPLERQAQLMANKIVSMKKEANRNMDADDIKKIKGQALEEARIRNGAHKDKIVITDREWEAIQLGAISNNVLTQIIANTDLDSLKVRSMPRTPKGLSTARIERARVMLANGYTQAEVASAVGVSTSTLLNAIK